MRSWDDAAVQDKDAFARWFRAMLEAGVHWVPSAFESAFTSAEHGETRTGAHGGSVRSGIRGGGAVVTRVVLLLLVAVALGVLPGCAQRAHRHDVTNSAADTLANGLPQTLLPKLAPWVQVWRHAIPAFTPDSLRHAGPVPFKFESGWAGTGGRINSIRTRALIEVVSPDSARSLDFDSYLDFGRGPDGNPLSEGEPDSRAVLADFKADSAWVVDFCGTTCSHDGAYWVDAERFVLTRTTQTGEQMDGPACPFLDIYDLRRGSAPAGSRCVDHIDKFAELSAGCVRQIDARRRYYDVDSAAIDGRILRGKELLKDRSGRMADRSCLTGLIILDWICRKDLTKDYLYPAFCIMMNAKHAALKS